VFETHRGQGLITLLVPITVMHDSTLADNIIIYAGELLAGPGKAGA
jgi:hypothetical protein